MEEGGEFEINQAKPAIGNPISHIANVGIVVLHTELL